MSFDASKHMSKLKGKDYLEVKWRLVWFREDHPDWGITTEIVQHDVEAGLAVVKAFIYNGSDSYMPPLSCGHKMETRKDFPDYLEKAETGAIGRALAALGYGTQFAPELEEGERVVDSPVAQPVPTRERDVADNPNIIRSADDPMWKRWLEVWSKANALGLNVQAIRLPQARADLRKLGEATIERIKMREAEVAG